MGMDMDSEPEVMPLEYTFHATQVIPESEYSEEPEKPAKKSAKSADEVIKNRRAAKKGY